MEKLRRWADTLSVWGERIGVAGIIVMVGVTTADVIGSKIFNLPVPGSTEIVSLAQVATIAFAVAATQRKRGHISVEMFVHRLSPRLQAAIRVVISMAGFMLFVLLIWGGIEFGHSLREAKEVSATVQIPFFPFAYAFSLAMVPVAAMMICDTMDSFKEVIALWNR